MEFSAGCGPEQAGGFPATGADEPHDRHCETRYKGGQFLQEVASPDIVDSRLANAFFAKADVSQDVDRLLPKFISRQISIGRRRQEGLWVGGKAVLTVCALRFSPNGMNRKLHADPEEMEVNIPLSRINGISVRRGFISDIIDIRSVDGDLKIRCFKARSFAAAIEAARLAAR